MIKLKKTKKDTKFTPKDDAIAKVVQEKAKVKETETEQAKDALPEKAPSSDEKKNFRGRMTIEFNRHTVPYFIAIITFAIVLYWALSHTKSLNIALSWIYNLFSPVIVGACIAFVLNVPMNGLEKIWKMIFAKKGGKMAEKLRRPICLVMSILLVLGVIFAAVFMVIPEFASSLKSLINSIPRFAANLEGWWDNILDFADEYGAILPDFKVDTDKIMNMALSLFNSLFGKGNSLFNQTISFTGTILSGVASFFVSFIFAIYLLAGKEKLAANSKRLLYAYVSEKHADRIVELSSMTNKTFFSFVTGQLTEALILGFLCFIGMQIFSFPYPIVVSVLVGITALIPLFGAFIGTAIGAFLIVLSSPIKAFWFVVFIIILQQVEGNLIYPRVVGKSVGLPGIWVLISVTVFGSAFGVLAMLVSVPLCAVAYSVLRTSVSNRLEKRKVGKEKFCPFKEREKNE
ncbi:MAG: AI-2E family transporter [Ruminococcaceae bacterium]|nr:AI-2E family transporter [Oscillospiraceae bacterium]